MVLCVWCVILFICVWFGDGWIKVFGFCDRCFICVLLFKMDLLDCVDDGLIVRIVIFRFMFVSIRLKVLIKVDLLMLGVLDRLIFRVVFWFVIVLISVWVCVWWLFWLFLIKVMVCVKVWWFLVSIWLVSFVICVFVIVWNELIFD